MILRLGTQFANDIGLRLDVRLMLVVWLLLAFFSGQVHAAKVDGVRLWRAPDHTRLVFDLSAPVEHKIFMLKAPHRLVIDLSSAQLESSLSDLSFVDTAIDRLRHGVRNKRDLRFVLDLTADVKPLSFILHKHGDKPDRLVVDLYDKQTKSVPVAIAQVSDQSLKRDIVVAIDPGHGGEDPGAIGPKRLYEKDVVLKVGQALAKIVNSAPGYKALLVRDGDYYIPLGERRKKAREARADIFISLHADGFDDPRAHGASVFALSKRGATSQTARILASKANESDLIGGAGSVSLKDKDNLLAGVLVDLSMTANLANSLDVGGRVLKRMARHAKLHTKHVEQAGFLVLKSPDVPSILVETGFITNQYEAKKLNTRSHRQKLAQAVFDGLNSYFTDKPPQGSYLAWKKNGGDHVRYIIARGDTLSGIAKKHRVSVAQIKSLNKLTSSTIRVGQALTIPKS